jgi:hypothetical protein
MINIIIIIVNNNFLYCLANLARSAASEAASPSRYYSSRVHGGHVQMFVPESHSIAVT